MESKKEKIMSKYNTLMEGTASCSHHQQRLFHPVPGYRSELWPSSGNAIGFCLCLCASWPLPLPFLAMLAFILLSYKYLWNDPVPVTFLVHPGNRLANERGHKWKKERQSVDTEFSRNRMILIVQTTLS